jgi:hypothetical protein
VKGVFTGELVTAQLWPKSRFDLVPLYRVESPLVYITRGGRTITVPVGFVSDGASVTRWLIWALVALAYLTGIFTGHAAWALASLLLLVCTRSGPWMPAAVLHDFLGVSREHDAIFLEAMVDGCKVARPIALLYWLGPTLFGWAYTAITNRTRPHGHGA